LREVLYYSGKMIGRMQVNLVEFFENANCLPTR